MKIKVEWELTANQRAELNSAIMAWRSHREKDHTPNEMEDIRVLCELVSSLKCGDPHCSYCGDGEPYYGEWDK